MQPEKKSNSLAKKINAMLDAKQKNDVALQAIKNELEALKAIDLLEYHRLKGAICCLQKDKAGLMNHFETAMKLRPNDDGIYSDYASLLANLGLMFIALNYARRANQIKKNPKILRLLIEITSSVARFTESFDYLAELKKMKLDISKEESLVDYGIITFIKRNALTDDDISFAVEKAELMAQKHHFEIEAFKAAIYHDGMEEWLSLNLSINATPKQIAQLEVDFVDDLVISMPENFPISKLSCGFVSA